MTPESDTTITYVDILDEMHFEMDITIHSFPEENAIGIILHCGSATNLWFPGIGILPESGTNGSENAGFAVRWSTIDETVQARTGEALSVDTEYHLEVDVTQSWLTLRVDGETMYQNVKEEHYTVEQMVCYLGDPWFGTANVTIENFRIFSSTW